jgi:tetratricopeptide (TPR) repeat protein
MAGLGIKHYISIALSLGLVVLLFFAPRHSGDAVAEAMATSNDEPPTVENRIDSALAIIASSAPMQGILLLREIAEEEPSNFRAQYHLGRFSAQTGQWEKVIERFEKVQEIDPSFAETNYWLGMAKMNLKQSFEAKAHLEAFLEQEKDKIELRDEAQRMLNQIP